MFASSAASVLMRSTGRRNPEKKVRKMKRKVTMTRVIDSSLMSVERSIPARMKVVASRSVANPMAKMFAVMGSENRVCPMKSTMRVGSAMMSKEDIPSESCSEMSRSGIVLRRA